MGYQFVVDMTDLRMPTAVDQAYLLTFLLRYILPVPDIVSIDLLYLKLDTIWYALHIKNKVFYRLKLLVA